MPSAQITSSPPTPGRATAASVAMEIGTSSVLTARSRNVSGAPEAVRPLTPSDAVVIGAIRWTLTGVTGDSTGAAGAGATTPAPSAMAGVCGSSSPGRSIGPDSAVVGLASGSMPMVATGGVLTPIRAPSSPGSATMVPTEVLTEVSMNSMVVMTSETGVVEPGSPTSNAGTAATVWWVALSTEATVLPTVWATSGSLS